MYGLTGHGRDMKRLNAVLCALEDAETVENNGYVFRFVGIAKDGIDLIVYAYNERKNEYAVGKYLHYDDEYGFTWGTGSYYTDGETAFDMYERATAFDLWVKGCKIL